MGPRSGRCERTCPPQVAVNETVTQLPPPPAAGASTVMERERQQNNSLVCPQVHVRGRGRAPLRGGRLLAPAGGHCKALPFRSRFHRVSHCLPLRFHCLSTAAVSFKRGLASSTMALITSGPCKVHNELECSDDLINIGATLRFIAAVSLRGAASEGTRDCACRETLHCHCRFLVCFNIRSRS